MIEINLLPAELRPTQPTPVPKLLALLGAGLFLLGEGLLLVYFHFNLTPAAQENLKELQGELKVRLDRAAQADLLRGEIDDFKLRAKTIIQIRQARTLWAKKLDQVIDIVPDYVWLSGITVTEGQGGKKPTGATITLSCLSMSSDEKRISTFLRGVKSHPVGKEIASISDPSYTLTEIATPTKEKLDALKFSLVIELKPRATSGAGKTEG